MPFHTLQLLNGRSVIHSAMPPTGMCRLPRLWRTPGTVPSRTAASEHMQHASVEDTSRDQML